MAAVDTTELPAQPTGRAAALAASHATSHPLKLYGGWFCPFVQRAWIVLQEKEENSKHSSSSPLYEYVEINPYKKAPEFLALNPRGLVPTLALPPIVEGGEPGVLYESTVICELLDEYFGGEEEENLLPRGMAPDNLYLRASCRLWIDHIGTRIVPAFYKLLQHTPDKTYTLDDARAGLLAALKTFTEQMAEDGPWFLGSRFSLVDVMLAPWAMRLFLLDHYKNGGSGIPKGGELTDENEKKIWSRWWRWFDAITERKSVKDTWSDDEMYIAAYRRYAEDTTQSEVGKATRTGGKLP
ncbi:glutathione S-transferase [Xylariaceae sp. FL0255]|nr:glutathione S-transferase [Xylariaceae sp. FL0255]